jgi:hypothetical protein
MQGIDGEGTRWLVVPHAGPLIHSPGGYPEGGRFLVFDTDDGRVIGRFDRLENAKRHIARLTKAHATD